MNTLKEGLSKPYFNPIILDKKQQQQKKRGHLKTQASLVPKEIKNKQLLRFPSPSDHTHL